jgi:hypothetical protein
MLVAGISLQLLAGFVFGLTYILPRDSFENANARLRRFLLSPWKGTRRLRILLLAALTIPPALLVAIMLRFNLIGIVEGRWYEIVFGLLIVWLIAAALYLSLLRGLAQLISKSKDLKDLPDDAYFRTLLRSNLILVAALGGLAWLSEWGASALSTANIVNVPEAVLLSSLLLLSFLFVFSLLSAGTSAVFIALVGVIELVSRMARPARVLWIIVLSIYVLGGAFLIASACRS